MKGGYPELNREHTVPHTAALPIELYPPIIIIIIKFYAYNFTILLSRNDSNIQY